LLLNKSAVFLQEHGAFVCPGQRPNKRHNGFGKKKTTTALPVDAADPAVQRKISTIEDGIGYQRKLNG